MIVPLSSHPIQRSNVFKICKYALEHRDSVTTIRKTTYTFSDALRSTVLEQATPALYNGEGTSLITVGSAFSKTGFLNAVPFYICRA
jgi:hypothetical protein